MRLSSIFALGAGVAAAQNMSLCDKYTSALLKENNATNQYTLLTLLINTAVIGNYTKPNMNAVAGILAKGTYMGQEVNLLPYFDGSLKSSNRGGDSGVSVNFLDGGGAAPLMKNMPANDKSSNQYMLLTHLYQFVGKLLGCSGYDSMGFPAYGGHAMGSVHRFMDLDRAQMGYFIEQVGLAASSFGVTKEDVTTIADALNKLFNYRCSPKTTVIPAMGPTLNSICQNQMCPLDPMAQCSAYPNNGVDMAPMYVNGTNMTMPSGTSPAASGKPSSTSTGVPASFTGGASSSQMGVGAVVGFAALAIVL